MLSKKFYYPQVRRAPYRCRIIDPSTPYRNRMLDITGISTVNPAWICVARKTQYGGCIRRPLARAAGTQETETDQGLSQTVSGRVCRGMSQVGRKLIPVPQLYPPPLQTPQGRHTLPGFQLFMAIVNWDSGYRNQKSTQLI